MIFQHNRIQQELRFAAEQSGVATNTFDTALQRFIRRSAEAANGTGEAKDALAALGIQLTDTAGKMRAPDALLADVANGFARVDSQAERVRLAFKLFDTEGVAMVNMLQDGSGAIAAMRQEAQMLGGVIGKDTTDSAAQFGDAMNRLNHVFRGIKMSILRNVLPFFQRLTNLSVGLWLGFAKLSKTTSIVRTSLMALGGIMAALGIKMAVAFAPAIVAMLPMIATVVGIAAGVTLLTVIVDDLIHLFSGGESAIGRFWNSLSDGAAQSWECIKDSFGRFAEWLMQSIQSLAHRGQKALLSLMPDFLRGGLSATAQFFGSGDGLKAVTQVNRTMTSSVLNRSSVYSPTNQSVKVDVHVSPGANAQSIGGEVARAVRVELEKERRNAFDSLVQYAPAT